ncbi:recombination mediator RecR [Acetobacterium wieringae]|jgi:recombination protein RecR|uniref:Recombination protein RecR n=1 Tax=Acetobacterium wieringae TaxID=52694 RepID=A0A1F2PF72_9FIRM|nr:MULTISPECIES: recombination mediator RecR [Acetobacterium]MEA4804465.1 recombination mediator RecR [Acetobacterium wieringae]OFV69933.1 recombination protein RecR [Acetobacterium wieringae]OXS25163.1 MAG: recombination protein RecR [Acetobacterium sp. MES1]TYC85864.1 recombination protein RecR [Acetobacterium wieringae]URN85319.1 recombination mediator RecR [Acetobacterium wieringae]
MGYYPKTLERLVLELGKLPGIGEKSAQRLAFHILSLSDEEIASLSEALTSAKAKIGLCQKCYTITDKEICDICENPKRDQQTICVVQNSRDIFAIEKTREYNGLYHVLHGAISPLDGIGPQDIKARELLLRLGENDIKEVIMATNATVEGEATAMYLGNLISPLGVKVTRLAKGIPIGADLEYTDEITLIKAFEGRSEI